MENITLPLHTSSEAKVLCANCADMAMSVALEHYCSLFAQQDNPCLKTYAMRSSQEQIEPAVKIVRISDPRKIWTFQLHDQKDNQCVCCEVINQERTNNITRHSGAYAEVAIGLLRFGLIKENHSKNREELEIGLATTESHLLGPGFLGFGFCLSTSSHAPCCLNRLCKSLIRQPSADLSFSRSRFDQCRLNHDICHASAKTRTESISNLRLIDCIDEKTVIAPSRARFAALSYVWGETPHVSPTSFPQTVKDAIVVTKSLGLHYLWVDAFCIDQSDPSILKQQLTQMAQIYRQAEVTIVAAAGKSANCGLAGISMKRARPERALVVDGVGLAEYRRPSWHKIPDTTWASRGWTFQESLASRRRLFFTQDELLFDCLSGWECELAPQRPRERLHRARQDSTLSFQTDYSGAPLYWYGEVSEQKIRELIWDYSRRVLTYASDVLKAFAGMRAEFRALDPAIHYYWGLPMLEGASLPNLLSGLCWEHCDLIYSRLQSRKERRRPGSTPSWSWVGWEAPDSAVRWNYEHHCTNKIFRPTAIEVELSCGTLVSWEQFATTLSRDKEEEDGTSTYLHVTAPSIPLCVHKEIDHQGKPRWSYRTSGGNYISRSRAQRVYPYDDEYPPLLGLLMYSMLNKHSESDFCFFMLVLIDKGSHYERWSCHTGSRSFHDGSENYQAESYFCGEEGMSKLLAMWEEKTVRIG